MPRILCRFSVRWCTQLIACHGRWLTALMGSAKLGDLLTNRASAVVFGHEHFRDAPKLLGKTTYYHQPLGYGLKRLFEWQSTDWLTEWRDTLVTLEVPAALTD